MNTLRETLRDGLRLTAQQWQEVEQELNLCLKEHRITTAQYLAALNEIKTLSTPRARMVAIR